ncbi:molybdopterin-guanine dinucleotide biosynthesis protein A [Mycobacterium intracellulare MOTT-02]|jgi:molybdopterin-guanine dinucleotide biosynthesis protein A|uniref:MobA-like NTP transferase domain protein n=5 Tax=Mycobacterium avium complex (MAC) TaxID=120793 RepID=X8CPM6_MYCIT|nr:molybdopterin-guanine dinucleotide biosynthesis protein A [Mycobacterium intracellulare MOTT-02]AFJ34492.1 molybdopterin-guanine dinucleotide biosynthesis protein A [Mycobacterium sp. MOTT36Y]ETZ32807.1 mobA-like NTP transferase domain protein [Mycobacterium intracellulare MIN_052511_1280]ETZ37585.1 mobA-like NTP transferase domain protein [Mycobacterium intracellulare MIN_061107_1834]EUA58327.1 mobA-like NTP transferase domain protein [Mycobacterium intracellulare 1956]BBY71228.1 putative 
MGRDKATLPGPGGAATLLEHVVGVVSQRCEPIFVMAAPGQPLPEVPARVLRDEVRGQGPLPATGGGLRAAAETGARFAFVCAVDMPLLSASLIDDLIGLATETNAEIVLPWDGRSHYLAAVYRTDLAERIDGLVAAGARSMRALIDASDAQQIVLPESRFLANVNSESDLRALAQLQA